MESKTKANEQPKAPIICIACKAIEEGQPAGLVHICGKDVLQCRHKGCENPSDFYVIFSMAVDKTHTPAKSSPILSVCKEHSDVEWKNVCDEGKWKLLCDQFRKMGRAVPTKEHSCIEIIPIPGR